MQEALNILQTQKNLKLEKSYFPNRGHEVEAMRMMIMSCSCKLQIRVPRANPVSHSGCFLRDVAAEP